MPGGYRQGSGRAKFGYYKGIYCGSTYELCWVIYNLDHNIPFKRFDGYLTDGTTKYYPDFLLDETSIVEIKGYHTIEVDKKSDLAIQKGYSIKVLYKEDLLYAFDYVKAKYGISNKGKFYTLYDSHKPKYQLTCSYCLLQYTSEKNPKTEIRFCSRICGGKYRFRDNKSNPLINSKMSNPPHTVKLSEEQVKEIYTATESYAIIAKKFNVNKSLVSHIKAKRIHKNILKNI